MKSVPNWAPWVLALALALPAAAPVLAAERAAVRSAEELASRLAKGPTALDALTPFGRQEFLENLVWGSRGLGGFSVAPLIRELDREQAQAVFEMFDVLRYFPPDFPNSPAVRFDSLSPEALQLLSSWKTLRNRPSEQAPRAVSHTMRRLPQWTEFFEEKIRALLGSGRLSALSDGDVWVLFDVAAQCLERASSEAAWAALQSIYAELQARKLNTMRGPARQMLRALMVHREFEQARTFVQAHPGLGAVQWPEILDSVGPAHRGETLLVQHGQVWQRLAAPLQTEGVQVVMVVSEGCGYSAKLLDSLEADPALQARLKQAHLLLLNALGDAQPYAFVQRWNARSPGLPMAIPFHSREWPWLQDGRVPLFILLKNGQPVHALAGWDEQGASKTRLIQALDALAR